MQCIAGTMPQIVNSFNGDFIGTVKKYNIKTRELDVFIPKLMPQIAEGRPTIKIKTNLSNQNLITHNSSVSIASTITVRAYDMSEPLPDIGSKVRINFLEGNFYYGFWRKFNVNEDYKVIYREKYPKQFTLQVGDKQVEVDQDDKIVIQLPDDFKFAMYSSGAKTKVINIIPSFEERLSNLEKRITELENK